MNVLYIDSIGVQGYLGGSHLSLLDVMGSMVQHGHVVSLGCPYEDVLTQEASKRGVKVLMFRLRKPFSTRIEWRGRRFFNWFAAFADILIYLHAGVSLWRLIRKVDPDIVHCNDMFLAISAGLGSRLARKACVWHVRSIPSHSVPTATIRFYGWLATLLSDRIVANSAATAKLLADSPAGRKVKLVYNGIDIDRFTALNGGARTREQLEIATETIVVAVVGRVVPAKGHEVLLRAMSSLPGGERFVLLVVGHYDPAGDYIARLRLNIVDLGLQARVRFAGFQKDIRPYVAAADIVVAASTEAESFGRTLVESMAAARPIIATRLGGHLEIVEDGVTGYLVAPNSPEEIADRVLRLGESDSLRQRMGEAGRERAMRLFSLEACARDLEGLYREMGSALQ